MRHAPLSRYACPVKLAAWLDEYRNLPAEEVMRPTGAVDDDDWAEQALIAPADRVRNTSPRWLERAERVGHARATHI